MNEEQKNVIFSALEGHSLIITGQCGTGKTFLLKHIIKELKKKNKEVAVTSTTGIASLQLHEGATTIHHWSGILDCRHNQSELKVLFDSDDRFQPPKDRITKADVLVIDEIGMMSKNVLETVEFVCRYVRKSKNDLAFGGLQVIASGDFKQLPPIENRRFEDDGAYCFTSNIFMKAFPHHVNLRKVMRQSEEDLVLAVNELCDGKPSSNTEELMKRLARPLHDPVNLVKIFGTNFDVDYVNQEMLDQMEGPEFVYKSIDKGDIKLLRKSPANRMLVLKVDAPVIIIRNIEGRIFNGSRGVINKLTDSEIVVTINNKIFNIPCVNFDIYDKHKKKSLASRLQFPIKLAFALTVHRAQGQTLPYVEIDCLSFFSPGQIGVAVGRAVNKLGLRIVNYNDSAAQLKHPEEVYNFYYQTFNTLSGDISCCTGQVIESKELKSTVYESTVEQHQSLHEEDQFSNIEKRTCPWDMNEFLKDNSETNYVKCKPENQDLFTEHVEVLYSVVAQTCEKENKKNSDWTAALKTINSFLVSNTHIRKCEQVFEIETNEISKNQNKLSTKLCMWLFEKEVGKRSNEILRCQTEKAVCESNPIEYTNASKSKIRYIAGSCINKISTRLRQSVIRSFQTKGPSKKIKEDRRFNYLKQNLLKQLQIKESEIDQTSIETCDEINFKQGESRGLRYVNDDVFNFFLKLNGQLQMCLSSNYFHLFCQDLHAKCRQNISGNIELEDSWVSLFTPCNEVEDDLFLTLILDLFYVVTEHFIRIGLSDSLQSFKSSLPRKKKQALRPKLQSLSEPAEKKLKSVAKDAAESSSVYLCNLCHEPCEWEPKDTSLESIACDICNCWHHFGCVGIEGTEQFLNDPNSKWKCSNCKDKGKGGGKGKSKGRGKGKKGR